MNLELVLCIDQNLMQYMDSQATMQTVPSNANGYLPYGADTFNNRGTQPGSNGANQTGQRRGERQPLLSSQANQEDHVDMLNGYIYFSDIEFRHIIDTVVTAINNGISPERIKQGSSGSYFVKDSQMVRDNSKQRAYDPRL